MRATRGVARVSWVLVLAGSMGCAEGVSPGPVIETDGPTVGGDGTFWCARVVGAYGWDGAELEHRLIVGAEEEPPMGCECADAMLTQQINELLNLPFNQWDLDADMDDDILVVGSSIQLGDEVGVIDPAIVNLRDQVILNAESDCLSIRTILGWSDTQDATNYPGCGEVADRTDEVDGVDPGPDVLAIYESTSCTVMDQMSAGIGRYLDHYVLANVIEYDSLDDVYLIDEDFFDAMLKNPGWWLDDSARIHPKAGGGYELRSVSSSDIAHALGLQSDDVFVSVDSLVLDDVVDAATAIEQLRTQASFALVVRRGVNNITLEYEKI